MRWLAVDLPWLPLEVFTRGLDRDLPMGIVEHRSQGGRVLLVNRSAAEAGIRSGMPVGAARALAADLHLLDRSPEREHRALGALALWAGGFTSQVSPAPPGALLLEAGRSLRLFGGPRSLIARVRQGLDDLGYGARLCLAPTPGGALQLARAGRELIVEGPQALCRALAGLPLERADLAPEALAALRHMGLEHLGQVLGLPRPGLGRRFGAAFVQRLERLLGETPDPRPLFEPPARYRGRLELPAEVQDTRALLFGARRLVLELTGFLVGRQAGAQRLDWTLIHADRSPTRFALGLLEPLSDAGPLIDLLRERLERLELPAPVREVRLAVDDLSAGAPRSGELFPETLRRPGGDGRLLERLRARLGPERVQGLAVAAEHRPERAWRNASPGESGGVASFGIRPLWLLAEPAPLDTREGRPWREGPLVLEGEGERIESGWWDGGDLARDYFVARTCGGERLWIFRELRGRRRWYLHGVFG
ncbi:MAG: DNA polymerase Y family protein [Chromatiales bacterium]